MGGENQQRWGNNSEQEHWVMVRLPSGVDLPSPASVRSLDHP